MCRIKMIDSKLKMFNPCIQTICLMIGLLGLMSVKKIAIYTDLHILYLRLFFVALILIFFLRKRKEPSITVSDNDIGGAFIRLGIACTLLTFLWNIIIVNLYSIRENSATIIFQMNNPVMNIVVHMANILFVICIWAWIYFKLRNDISKRFLFGFSTLYFLIALTNIMFNIAWSYMVMTIYILPFIILFFLGVFRLLKWRHVS